VAKVDNRLNAGEHRDEALLCITECLRRLAVLIAFAVHRPMSKTPQVLQELDGFGTVQSGLIEVDLEFLERA
jgi:hypothetical protein